MHSFDGVFLLYTISREIINPRRACAARVTVVGFSVCPLVANSLQERLFVRSSNEGQKSVGFSLKPLRCRDPALPPLYGHAYSRPFFSCTYFSCTPPRVQHYSAFHYKHNFYDAILLT